jgi:hypothetical protein
MATPSANIEQRLRKSVIPRANGFSNAGWYFKCMFVLFILVIVIDAKASEQGRLWHEKTGNLKSEGGNIECLLKKPFNLIFKIEWQRETTVVDWVLAD